MYADFLLDLMYAEPDHECWAGSAANHGRNEEGEMVKNMGRRVLTALGVVGVASLILATSEPSEVHAADYVQHWATGTSCSDCAAKRPCCDKTGECREASSSCTTGQVYKCAWSHYH